MLSARSQSTVIVGRAVGRSYYMFEISQCGFRRARFGRHSSLVQPKLMKLGVQMHLVVLYISKKF